MNIKGIGNDIIEIDRIKTAIERTEKFKYKIFTEKEIEYAEKSKLPYNTYAGKFAAKEAIAKALGTGVSGFSFKDIEILNENNGKPYAILSDVLKEKYKNIEIMITISHNKSNAIATSLVMDL